MGAERRDGALREAMGSELACPVCGGTADPRLRIGALAICSICGASLFVEDDGTARRMTLADGKDVPAADLDSLKVAHAAFRRLKKPTVNG